MATEEIENLYKELTTKNGSSAAAPRETQLHLEQARILSKQDEERQRKWYNSGVKAKQRGYGDFSPFYENATADYFFKCGYDNVPFVEAQQVLKEKIQQIMETDPLLTEVTDEYAKAAKQFDLK